MVKKARQCGLRKAMRPLIDKLLVHYVAEEAVVSGSKQILFVTGRGKRALVDDFDIAFELGQRLQECEKNQIGEVGEK